MEISKELITHIIKKTQDPEQISDTIKKYTIIHNNIKKTYDEESTARKKCQTTIEDCQRTRKLIQDSCDHPFVRKHSDPSGGNDYSKECDVCKKEW